MKTQANLICILISFFLMSCQGKSQEKVSIKNQETVKKINEQQLNNLNVVYLASGCFWCVEAIYETIPGVEEAVSGYSGGNTDQINYQLSNYGSTGNAEALAVYYHPDQVSFQELIKIYFASQDPEQKNGQGPDCGSQYRSILFYNNDNERQIIEQEIKRLEDKGVAVAAEVQPFEYFVVAEDYHQDFKKRNPNNPYIKNVSNRRYEKFLENYEKEAN